MQAVLLVLFNICLVSNNERADFTILEIRPAGDPLYEHILAAMEVRLHAVAVDGEYAVSLIHVRRGVDIDILAFIDKLCRITGTSS